MPKHEPLTAKAIGKRIKSKGLQKLKFFCQMCQKQCRDENGFKCHMTSEAHQRQLLLFAENPHKYMDEFSGEFMKDFVHLLKRRYSTKRVFANQVYQEYIKDRNHLHMNSTRWVTLTGFVKWMGRKGICHVDHTEKGWFITYIDRDPETLARQENLAKKEKMAKDDEERQAKVIEDMIKRGRLLEELKSDPQTNDDDQNSQDQTERMMLKKENEDQKIVFSLAAKKPLENQPSLAKLAGKSSSVMIKKEESDEESERQVDIESIQPKPAKPQMFAPTKSNVFKRELKLELKQEDDQDSKQSVLRKISSKDTHRPAKSGTKRPKSALDEIIEEQERWKARKANQQQQQQQGDRNGNRSYDHRAGSSSSSSRQTSQSWLVPQIVVRVIAKELGPEYYNKKAVVTKLVDQFGAVIRMSQSGDLVKVDEQHLETVIPKVGARVVVLRGLYRERLATIVDIDMKQETIQAKVDNSSSGKIIQFTFDDVSKLSDD